MARCLHMVFSLFNHHDAKYGQPGLRQGPQDGVARAGRLQRIDSFWCTAW